MAARKASAARRPKVAGTSNAGKNKKTGKRPAARARVPRESDAQAALRLAQVLDRLEVAHPEATCALLHHDPYQLVMATILSAQCTDQRVNMVTPQLFARYPTTAALAGARAIDVEELIRSTGFFRAKTKSLIGCAQALVRDHGGRVPPDMAALVRLPGIGRKTANVVLGHAFALAEGIAVDTHVLRVSERLGVHAGDEAEAVERRLMALIGRERWTRTSDLLIFHGRKVCDARRPTCGTCTLFDLCRYPGRQAVALGSSAPGPSRARRPKGGKPRRTEA